MQIPEFTSARVLVAGDIMLDRYWHGSASRISPEAPVPIVRIHSTQERPGGAGNVALNIASLGSHVTLLGYSGDDESGYRLATLLEQSGVKVLIEPTQHCPTITKLRVLSQHQQIIRLDFEERFDHVSSHFLLHSFSSFLNEADIIVLSDYDKGTLHNIPMLISMAREAGKRVLVDPKKTDFTQYHGAYLLTPNRAECEAVIGYCSTEAELVEKGERLRESLSLEALLITRGEQGMTLLRRGETVLHLPTHAQEVYDVTGAGDTVIAVLATSLAAGASLSDATRLANVAAGLVVEKLGTASVTSQELKDAFRAEPVKQRGIVDLETLLELVNMARQRGETIVLTNGCFDLLHPGHVHYLQKARGLGDRLVVLVNSDASIQRLKGKDRPIYPLRHRLEMLAALECVDWVVSFDEDTPREAIRCILPDILVKGGDYSVIESVAGYEYVLASGGEVRLLDVLGGFSTTSLITRLKNYD